jgi:hypothetical protein
MPRPRLPEQLDIPLVWDRPEGMAGPPPPGEQLRTGRRGPPPCGSLTLLGGAVLDLGAILLALAAAWVAAALTGVTMLSGQIAVAALFGCELLTVVALGCLWGWGGTPGLLLVGVRASSQVALPRAFDFWLAWLVSLPLLALPLLIGRRGMRPAERLIGASFSLR